MTPEELMKPRYKVIASYPHIEMDQHGVGDIISPYGMGFIYPEKVKEQYDTYPHLFQKLEWWEERKIEDMPEYVKVVGVGCSFPVGDVLKPLEWGVFPDEGRKLGNENIPYALCEILESDRTYDVGEHIRMGGKNIIPTTKEEHILASKSEK